MPPPPTLPLRAAVEPPPPQKSLVTAPFLSLSLQLFPHSPLSHTSARDPQVVGTGKRPNGKKRKRGRGRGEEEEADPAQVAEQGGWDLVLMRTEKETATVADAQLEWHWWGGP